MKLIYKLIKNYPGCSEPIEYEHVIEPFENTIIEPYYKYKDYYKLVGVISEDNFKIYNDTKIKLLQISKCSSKNPMERVSILTQTIYNGRFHIDLNGTFWLITDITNVKIPIYQKLSDGDCSDKIFFKDDACQAYFNTIKL